MIFSFSRYSRSKKQLTNIRHLNCYFVAIDKRKDTLTWKERIQIAVDAAQGLLAEWLVINLIFVSVYILLSN